MAILNIQTSVTGLSSVLPGIIYILTDETLSEVVNNAGFLNAYSDEVTKYSSALVYTTDEGAVLLRIVYSGVNIGLAAQTAGGVVQVPVTVGHAAVYSTTNGGLYQDANPMVNSGIIQSGVNGVQGGFTAYPNTANKGYLEIIPTSNQGNYYISISNDSFNQSTDILLPDPEQLSTSFILADSPSTQVINTGNLEIAEGDLIVGTAGFDSAIVLHPSSNNTGTLVFTALNNIEGNLSTTVTNDVSIGQNQTISIPDGGTSASNFIISNSSSAQTISTGDLILNVGNLILNEGNETISLGNLTLGQGNLTLNNGSIAALKGDLTLGSNNSGVTPYVSLYTAGENTGKLEIVPTNNAGNFNTIITNDPMGQTSTLGIPDPANTYGQFLIGATATPFTNNHLLKASGTTGVVADAGFGMVYGSTTGVGVTPVVICPATNVTSSSTILVTVTSIADPAISLLTATAGTASITLTFSSIPGAVSINYIAINT